ncbi:glycosyltransferase [Aureibaculum marinum]|uniref:glycosyltransferase n=1 Tax=Aureibaculum marinum TaxID=2487930 RepID=UPI0013966AC3|nr:glycosyltransferase [Aureibaculum marinum]
MKIKLSFVIPLYNAEKYIEQCINSIINQSLKEEEFEIIIINDGSIDNSLSKAIEISKNYKNVEVYDQINKGVSATRNRGIDLARGTYIWFIDSDDYIISDTANELLSFAEDNSLDILEFKMIRTESRVLNKTINKGVNRSEVKILDGKEYSSKVDLSDSTCTNLYRRKFIIDSEVRFIEGKIMEDMTFNAELFPQAKRIAFYPLDAYRYVINPNSIWTNKESKAYRKSIEDFIFMTKKFSNFIEEYKKEGIDTNLIKNKQQEMLYNISKRLLLCDFKLSEIKLKIDDLSSHNLYPINPYLGHSYYKKLETFLFNKKYLFLLSVLLYRLFKRPINYFIIKNHQRKREKRIKEIVVKFEEEKVAI